MSDDTVDIFVDEKIFEDVHKTICFSMSSEENKIKPLNKKEIPKFMKEYFAASDFYIISVNEYLKTQIK